MSKRKGNPPPLAHGDYVSTRSGTDELQRAAARRCLMETVGQVCPEFLESLRDEVFERFLKLAAKHNSAWGTPYWKAGGRFDTWRTQSDPRNELTPHLRQWARKFNAEEDWILEGALQTMWLWKKNPREAQSLGMKGFYPYAAGDVLLSGAETAFCFEDPGWQPELDRWEKYRATVRKRFDRALADYGKKIRSTIRNCGAERARVARDVQAFNWLARYQFNGEKLDAIRSLPGFHYEQTTIWHGIRRAADLAGIRLRKRPRRGKTVFRRTLK